MTTKLNNTVCFCNNGTLDKRAFTMLGLSAKGSDNAIGFFGTGFKYAIATLLRNGHDVRVVARNSLYEGHAESERYTEYTFSTVRDKFRDKEFDFIRCESKDGIIELPFTTHLGANWKVWQAYRELYTNALDEGGDVHLVEDKGSMYDHSGSDGVQVIVSGPEIVGVYEQHDKYFLSAPTLVNGYRMRAVEKQYNGDNVVYYKTMYTGTKVDKETYFTYDYIKTQELTEDRTLADTWFLRHHIGELWIENMSYDMLVEHLPKISDDRYYEYGIEASHQDGSDDFHRACAYLNKMERPMPMWARDIYTKKLPFDKQIEQYKPTRYQRTQLNKALDILAHHRHHIDTNKLVTCASLPNDVLGYYKDNTIYIAKEAFERGFEKLLGTIYEEYLHMTVECEDMSRVMQNYLVDKCAVLMQSVYEMEQDMLKEHLP